MYKFHKKEIIVAWLCLLFIIGFYATSFISLVVVRPDIDFNSSPLDSFSDVWQVINDVFLRYFPNTFVQASLSATVILILGYVMAKAMIYLPIKLRHILLTITNSSFSLPTILVIFAIINVMGTNGWVNNFLAFIGIHWQVNVFGLVGIVVANAYFNIGYTATAIYNNLQKIPLEQIMLARQYSIENFKYFKHVELPYLKTNVLNLWLLMFMLCFNSFALLLFLGGGPKYSNFEVGIYNSLTQDLNFSKALVIAGTQIVFSIILISIISVVSPKQTEANNIALQEFTFNNFIQSQTSYAHLKTKLSKVYSVILILYIGIPLLSLVVAGIESIVLLLHNYFSLDLNSNSSLSTLASSTSNGDVSSYSTSSNSSAINQTVQLTGDMFTYSWKALIQASEFSLIFALGTGIVCIAISIAILRGFRWLGKQNQVILNNMSLLGLAIPNMLVGAGYYMLFNIGLNFTVGTWVLVVLIILATSFNSLAYALNFLAPAYKQVHNYSALAQSLGLSSWQSFRIYEFKLLRNSLILSFINIFVLALGDFSIILFFVNNKLTSITYLLAQQLGGFKSNQGNVTALVLLAIILILRYLAYSKVLKGKSVASLALHH